MLSVHSFSYTYPNGIEALKNVSVMVSPGEFVLMCGPNGGGKSTLLKAILGIVPEYFGGDVKGSITFGGKPVGEYGITGLAGIIGIVLQDPESQISNTNVWEEITFALGNLLFPREEIILRATDALQRMELSELKGSSVDALSGGQMQRLSIAALIALRPRILIFDEPLANLDPLGVVSVVDALRRVKGFVDVVIVASHWLDPFLELATRLMVIDSGQLVLDIDPASVRDHLDTLKAHHVEIPQKLKIENVLRLQGAKVEIIDGSIYLQDSVALKPCQIAHLPDNPTAISLEGVAYAYPDGTTPLRDITACIACGSHLALVGHNGTGKTTLARLLAGLRKPTAGHLVNRSASIAMMLQKPSLGFIATTVQDELAYGTDLSDAEVLTLLARFDLLRYRSMSPFELSGGEQRRLALALTAAKRYDLLLLDEPTAGLDAAQVRVLQEVLEDFEGTAIYITHDPRLIGNFLKEIIVLDDGRVQFHGSTTELNRGLLEYLGYPGINPTVALALRYLDSQVPMSPEQLEVCSAISV